MSKEKIEYQDIRDLELKQKVEIYNHILNHYINKETLYGDTGELPGVKIDIKDIHIITDNSFAYYWAGAERFRKEFFDRGVKL